MRLVGQVRRRFLFSLVAALGCEADEITGPDNDPGPTRVSLQSQAGDYIGQGRIYEYSQANAVITVSVSGGLLSIDIVGDQRWTGEFEMPGGMARLQPGHYANLQRYPFHDPARGGLSWSGEGRGCNTLTGSFTIDRISYDQDSLTAIELRFQQNCEGGVSALQGAVRWNANDTTRPPGPISPVPTQLWQPAPGATPLSGDYIYLDSDLGDWVGGGGTRTFTRASHTIDVIVNGGYLLVRVNGGDWSGDFQTMNTLGRLEVGYYPNLRRWPFHNPAKGGLSWSGVGRGCNELVGWVAIDRVSYANGNLSAIDLRFEQHCEEASPALHGAIRLTAPGVVLTS